MLLPSYPQKCQAFHSTHYISLKIRSNQKKSPGLTFQDARNISLTPQQAPIHTISQEDTFSMSVATLDRCIEL